MEKSFLIAAFLSFLLFGPWYQSGRWLNYCKKEKQGVADVTECNVVRTAESLNKESVFSFNSIFFFLFLFWPPRLSRRHLFSLFLIFLRYSRRSSFSILKRKQVPLKVFYHISMPLTFHRVMEMYQRVRFDWTGVAKRIIHLTYLEIFGLTWWNLPEVMFSISIFLFYPLKVTQHVKWQKFSSEIN